MGIFDSAVIKYNERLDKEHKEFLEEVEAFRGKVRNHIKHIFRDYAQFDENKLVVDNTSSGIYTIEDSGHIAELFIMKSHKRDNELYCRMYTFDGTHLVEESYGNRYTILSFSDIGRIYAFLTKSEKGEVSL